MNYLFETLADDRWLRAITEHVDSGVLTALEDFLIEQQRSGKDIYPAKENWFRALNTVPVDKVKVVILGQDPYHGPNQAHGFSFSVPGDTRLPPSLKNIFQEQQQDLGIHNSSGDLSAWAQQGVLLLNSVLTVEKSSAGSHAKKGWEQVTDAVIEACNENESPIVFLLWGAYAIKKQSLITNKKHLVLTSAHPSPLSAHRGWFGCGHFSKTNQYLETFNLSPIDWQLNSQPQKTFSF
ncbi:uracil-DNA glycosylase [Reinekea marinisedimentorum]|uniref:Uracil-DNA glycosylase n=1 Tax=Reinekea marinisedimentorum TaxID=230495 RepID=A0A4R3I307_9GAMM|nr:uracil-DNA glycosylase [Reinekea marinisedimentorum]TCS40168.1 uracil-DNA glycosylase [Reinekea marinisedimentorum]